MILHDLLKMLHGRQNPLFKHQVVCVQENVLISRIARENPLSRDQQPNTKLAISNTKIAAIGWPSTGSILGQNPECYMIM